MAGRSRVFCDCDSTNSIRWWAFSEKKKLNTN
jgi:hypothetical protein